MNKRENYLKSINKLVINLMLVIVLSATVGNILDVLKGTKSVMVSAIFLIMGSVMLGYLFMLYKKVPHSTKIKLYAYVTFFLLYTYTIFTTTKVLVFIYIMPVMFMYILYHDVRFMKYVASSVMIVNILRVVWMLVFCGLTDKSFVTDYTIQIIALAVVCWNVIAAAIMTKKFNNDSINELKEANESQEIILKEVLQLGNLLDKHSNEIYTIVSNLENSSEVMNDNIEDMNKGINNTISNMDTQINLTENIHLAIINAVDTSKELEEISESTIKEINKGFSIVKDLIQKKTIINENGSLVHESMVNLKEKTNEIGNIINTITSIADQTNILSLNAAIESARAGEAGKGFSIVAKEVGILAEQTSQSVADIGKIIFNLQQMVDASVDAIEEFTNANLAQNKLIQDTEDIFKSTVENMNKVNEEIFDVSNKINTILTSNNEIVKSIQVISKDNEVTKSSINETSVATNQTLVNINKTKKIAKELLDVSKGLKKYL